MSGVWAVSLMDGWEVITGITAVIGGADVPGCTWHGRSAVLWTPDGQGFTNVQFEADRVVVLDGVAA